MDRDKNPHGYRIICTKEGPDQRAYFRSLDGQCLPGEVCVDEFSGTVHRAHCERQEYTSASPSKRRKTGSYSTLAKRFAAVSQDDVSLASNRYGLGPDKTPPADPRDKGPASRAIQQCTGTHADWAFVSSACHRTQKSTKYKAYKIMCSRRYKWQRQLGEDERNSVTVLSGICSPEEVCVDGRGFAGKAYCVRHELLIGMARDGLNAIAGSKPKEKLQASQNFDTDFQNLALRPVTADGKKQALINKRYKREMGTVIAQCPGQPQWHLVSSGCDPTNHRKFWVVCSEPVPIWHIPREVTHEGECTEREICVNSALGSSPNPIRGLEYHYYPVAKCVRLGDWAMSQRAYGVHVQIRRSRPVDRLSDQQEYLVKRGASSTPNGRFIKMCAGEHWDWPVVLSGCQGRDPRKYYTICAEPIPIWHIPEQVRSEGQCSEGEVCVDGRIIGGPIQGLESFEYFSAKCVQVSEGQGHAKPGENTTSGPRTPSPRPPQEHNPSPPTASSTPKHRSWDPKTPGTRRDGTALIPQHEIAKRKTKWRPINECPGNHNPRNWLLWTVSCDSKSPSRYTVVCKQRFLGIRGVHIYGQTISIRGGCKDNEICVQGRKPSTANCVSHEAFTKIAVDNTEDHQSTGKPLPMRHTSLAERGTLTGHRNWRPINQCTGARSHWPVDYSACDPAQGLRFYYFRCIEPNVTNGRVVARIIGSGRCEENEICVNDESKGVAHCVGHESFARMARILGSADRRVDMRSVQQPSFMQKRTGERPLEHCIGGSARWNVQSSSCNEDSPRSYSIVCSEPGTARLVKQTGECLPAEICVSGDANAPQNPKIEFPYRKHGIARCIPRPSFPDIAQRATQGKEDAKQRGANYTQAPQNQPMSRQEYQTQANQSQSNQSLAMPHLSLEKRTTSCFINKCPQPYEKWTAMTSGCVGDPRAYTIWCRSPGMSEFEPISGRCAEDEICISGLSTPGRLLRENEHPAVRMARCQKKISIVRMPELAIKRYKAHGRTQKRAPEKPIDGRLVNQCPEHSSWTVWSSACDPNKPRRYLIRCRNPNLSNFVHLAGQCSKNEICVSGFKGEVRPFPTGPSEYWHYGLAKCVKQDSFVQAVLAGKREEGVTTEQPNKLLSRRNNWRPIDQCPGHPTWEVHTSVCDPKDPRHYWITCTRPYKHSRAFRSAHPAEGTCLANEICVSAHSEPPPVSQAHQILFNDHGIAHCVKHEGFARIAKLYTKYNKKTNATQSETATVNAPRTELRKWKRDLTERANWRAITACPEGSGFLSSVCTAGTARKYSMACRSYLNLPQSLIHCTGECGEDEVCVSAGYSKVHLYQDYVKSHCVKHEGFARIAKVFQKYHKKPNVNATESTIQSTNTANRQEKRDLKPRTNWRRLDKCPGKPHLRVKTSFCNPENPRQYFVTCEYPISRGAGHQGLVHYFGECRDDEVCVSGYTVANPSSPYQGLVKDYGIAHCVNHDGFNRLAQLAQKYKAKAKSKGMEGQDMRNQNMKSQIIGSKTTESKMQKRNLEKRADWHHIDKCPEGYTSWKLITSVCDSKDARKYWIICHAPYTNGRYARTMISRQGECSKTEVCISGYRGAVPETPIAQNQVRDFGIAKCASQQSYVRIAKMVTERRKEEERKQHAKRASNQAGSKQIALPAVVETGSINISASSTQTADQHLRSPKQPMSRPLNVCPDAYRGWVVISSSCSLRGGSRRHYRVWCALLPYAFAGPHVWLEGECSNEEVCVPGAGGTETIPHPRGEKRNLINAKRAACVSIEKVSRIAKVMLDRKAKTRASSALTASGNTHDGWETAFEKAHIAED